MDWRDAERSFDHPAISDRPVAAIPATSSEEYGTEPAQRYRGREGRALVPDVLPAPDADDGYGELTYNEFAGVVGYLAAGFRKLGIDPDDRVAIYAETRMEWAQADFALLAAGAVVTTVYAGSRPERVAHLLDDPGASAAVVSGTDELATIESVDVDLDPIVTMDAVETDRDDVYGLDEVLELGRTDFDPTLFRGWLDDREADELATLIYTSGTTGEPKGVRLTHGHLRANVAQLVRRLGPRPDRPDDLTVARPGEVSLSFLPLAHVFERTVGHMTPLATGVTVCYGHPDTVADDARLFEPTIVTAVPRVYEKMYDRIEDRVAESPVRKRLLDWASGVAGRHTAASDPGPLLRAQYALADRLVFDRVRSALGGRIGLAISGGGRLSSSLTATFHGMGIPIIEGYGLTETGPVVTVNPPEAVRIGTIGPPLPDCEIRLDTSVGEIEPTRGGEVGELLVRGPNVTDGYWRQPERTRQAFSDGWLRTGDIVERGDDDYLTFHERVKELLVLSTGKNVAPGPIEDTFIAEPLIDQCVVVGDGMKHVAALFVPNVDRVRDWAADAGHDLPDDAEAICDDDRVRAHVEGIVDRVNDRFDDHERIREVALVPEELTEADGLLTPTLKKRRPAITDRYRETIAGLYD
ncbi:long-chain fatty acid--CoA ligase [Halobacteriales archaeon SW_7_68_16]|nr:MAG: long-chain fatty acid--CoA ligase [Halobacteriales archaeon SW_7_68_16]